MTSSMELYNHEAEALVLAGFLKNADAYWSLNDIGLTSDDFMSQENKRVMRAVLALTADKKLPELPNVVEELKTSDHPGTIDYLNKLISLPVSTAQARDYARTVKGLSVGRQLTMVGAQFQTIAAEKRADAEGAIAEAEALLRKVASSIPQPDHSPDPLDILRRMRAAGPMSSIPIDFSPTLQELSGGFIPGHLWVIGGFSSTGKTAVACNIVADVLRVRDKWAMLVTNEMTQEQYMVRMLSLMSAIPQRQIRDRLPMDFEAAESLRRAEQGLARSNLRVHEMYRIGDIRSHATRMKETIGLDVLLVDFLQNVRGEVGDFSFGDLTGITLDLQQLAKDLRITVVAFSQVSNEMAKWESQGGDDNFYAFKGSGAIKDASDISIMLKRDRVRQSPTLDMHVMKNRHGELRVVSTHIDLPTGRITEDVTIGDDDA